MGTDSYAYGMWTVVIFNIALLLVFVLSFLRPRKRWEWRSMGMFSAFVVALFTEMYGFPLSIYLLTSVLGSRYPVTNPFSHLNGNLWALLLGGSEYLSGVFMLLGGVAMLAGLILMGRAWRQIHKANGSLVTSGLYRWVRHPQYSALFLVTFGFLIQWPTLITLIMWPLLMLVYYRLAIREEKEMEGCFGNEYVIYKHQVPMFWPKLTPVSGADKARG